MEPVCFAIEVMYLGVLDAVGGSADGFAEVGRIVCFVEFCFGKIEDDVVAGDDEGLDAGAVGEEGECR